MRLPVETTSTTPTTALGDWTAHVVFAGRTPLILSVAERSLLPVLVPAREISTLIPRFRQAVGELLRAVGVPWEAVQDELAAMAEVVIGKTNSRRVLGSLNDFARIAESYLNDVSLQQVSLRLAETPCSPLDMDSPRRATLAIFSVTTIPRI